ncbi:hypothetical protein CASFOL_001770 [Castilleja foliolosa]|uniref:Uncharacterized protein n=1 Tax=Castilleja foliolosa TaxID=1961234 RepID=A0ABD3EG01_9LAMI
MLSVWRDPSGCSVLHSFDAANEDADALLQNAKYMLQNVMDDTC